jgi:hypothetical protein
LQAARDAILRSAMFEEDKDLHADLPNAQLNNSEQTINEVQMNILKLGICCSGQ